MELGVSEWHEVTLRNIGAGSDALQVSVNGTVSEHSAISGTDTLLDLGLLDGPLYIGGHPNILEIQVGVIGFCCTKVYTVPPTYKL